MARLLKAQLKRSEGALTNKIANLKIKTKNCKRNTSKKHRYAQVRASIRRRMKGKRANLKPMTTGQKKNIGALASYNRKYLMGGKK